MLPGQNYIKVLIREHALLTGRLWGEYAFICVENPSWCRQSVWARKMYLYNGQHYCTLLSFLWYILFMQRNI